MVYNTLRREGTYIKNNFEKSNSYYIPLTDGSSALDNSYKDEDDVKNIKFEMPMIRKLTIVKETNKKVFMGCWQGCNEDNEVDGC